MILTEKIGLATRVFLPDWWVNAYEASIFASDDEASSLETIICRGLLPAMSAVELNALALILSDIQCQILANSGNTIILNPQSILSRIGGTGHTARGVAERMLLSLGGLRLQAHQDDGSVVSNLIFTQERWAAQSQKVADSSSSNKGSTSVDDDSICLELTLSSHGADLLLGYRDPYFSVAQYSCGYSSIIWGNPSLRDNSSIPADSDLSLFARSARSARSARWTPQGSHPPLSLWKSVWLDLQGAEQAVMLQLEKQMQWSSQWLSWDGVFETSLATLFKGVRVPKSRTQSSILARQLKVFDKLGRKLVEHGFLTESVDRGYLAFDTSGSRIDNSGQSNSGESARTPEASGFKVAWKIASERLLGEEPRVYSRAVSSYFASREIIHCSDYEARYAHFLPGVAVSVSGEYVRQFLPSMQNLLQDLETDRMNPIQLKGNSLLSLPQLFVEWNLRQLAGNNLALPEGLADSEAAKYASPESRISIADRFSRFCDEIEEHPRYREAINSTPFMSVVSEPTLATPEFSEWLSQCANNNKAKLGYRQSVGSGPQLVFSQKPPAPSELPEAKPTDVGTVPGSQLQQVVSPKSSGEYGTTSKQAANGHAKTSAARISRMRRIATDELLKLRSRFPKRYESLKSMYMDSLTQSEQHLIIDVRGRMQASKFDDHLRHHLVKFMIKNPSSWSSAEEG